jgi:hypothetical protein
MTETTFTNLRVLNKNKFAISDRYDGVPYIFEPGKSLTIPGDAAAHMFGWKDGVPTATVKSHVQKRWGWNTADLQQAGKADKYFENLELTPVRMRLVEEIAPAAVPVDEEPQRPISVRPGKSA